MEAAKRFQAKLRLRGGHLLWTGGKQFWNGRKLVSPHHYAFTIAHGKKLKPQACIRAICGHKDCVRPDHLKLGRPAGAEHGRARLTAQQVRSIRKRYRWYYVTANDLAREYKVAVATIQRVLAHKTWKITKTQTK